MLKKRFSLRWTQFEPSHTHIPVKYSLFSFKSQLCPKIAKCGAFGGWKVIWSITENWRDFSAMPPSPLLQRVATFYWLAFNTATTQQRALLLSRVLDSNPKCMEISVSVQFGRYTYDWTEYQLALINTWGEEKTKLQCLYKMVSSLLYHSKAILNHHDTASLFYQTDCL